jgi:hypothetical protein
VIRFVMTAGHEYTLADLRGDPAAPRLEILTYDRLLAARRLPQAVYVFTDHDRLGLADLELAAVVARTLRAKGLPVLNAPARVLTRYGLLRALHEEGINDFNAYRVEERVRPSRYPVFLRRDDGHRKPLSDLLDDWDATRRAIDAACAAGVPERRMIVVEYAGEPAAPGIFRKLSVLRVGDCDSPEPFGHDERWLVKYGKRGIAPPALYEDEHRIVRENPFGEVVSRAFEIAGLEYGRADFGLLRGRPQIFEINTNPHVRPGGAHPVPLRLETQRLSWERHVQAFRALAERAPSGPPVALRDKRLRPHQGWRGRLVRTRRAP